MERTGIRTKSCERINCLEILPDTQRRALNKTAEITKVASEEIPVNMRG